MNFDGYSQAGFSFAERTDAIRRPHPFHPWSPRYRAFKYMFDKAMVILALPLIAAVALVLLVLNPWLNPGPLLFSQERMGMGGARFRMLKFRTMLPAEYEVRAHDAGLEEHRITPLGRILRKTRIDELPNFWNVLRGEMSVVGPRPDALSHALVHMRTVPYYQVRFRVKPGITGLAQVRSGYADCARSTRRKARFDRTYVAKSRIKMDLYVIRRTIGVMLTGFGAK